MLLQKKQQHIFWGACEYLKATYIIVSNPSPPFQRQLDPVYTLTSETLKSPPMTTQVTGAMRWEQSFRMVCA